MNILFCLTPKSDVDYVTEDASLFKTLQTMERRNHSAIPIISKKGRYIGTITAGDILGCIKTNFNLSLKDSADFPVKNVHRTRDNQAVSVNSKMEDIVEIILTQNFVPVVDDDENFIGIITRKEIVMWLHDRLLDNETDIK